VARSIRGGFFDGTCVVCTIGAPYAQPSGGSWSATCRGGGHSPVRAWRARQPTIIIGQPVLRAARSADLPGARRRSPPEELVGETGQYTNRAIGSIGRSLAVGRRSGRR